jgi:hypothetical protein
MELAKALRANPHPKMKVRLKPGDFSLLREAVEQDGFPFSSEKDLEEKFNQLRGQYEPYALAIGEELMITLPPWIN